MTYHIITHGCQMNEADSDLMSGVLNQAGWEAAAAYQEADLLIINTCSVRQRPEHKVYSLLGELRPWKEENPARLLAVAGCMAQRVGEEILRRARHVDIVMGTRWFHRIDDLVARALHGERPVLALDVEEDPSSARCRESAVTIPAPLRPFVPIIRGCTNFCTYCIVPFVRGPEASRTIDDVAAEVESLVARGAREVTLLGQNVLAYGRDLADGTTFDRLLSRLKDTDGLWRLRFTTSHPRDVTPALINAMADLPKVCEHLHLPLQAGSDKVLREMNRGYTTARYLEIVEDLRSRIPGLALTTDLLVGFPGETAEEFEESFRFCERVRFDSAFMFAYSPRDGTAAAARPDQVPKDVRLERLGRLIEMQNQISIERNREQIGEEAEVLVDGPAHRGEGLLAGRARNNKQVIFPGAPALAGTLVSVRLTEAHLWGFMATL